MKKIERKIEVRQEGFHGVKTLIISGIWEPWNEIGLAVEMTKEAIKQMYKSISCHAPGSTCICGGYYTPDEVDINKYLVPLTWIDDDDLIKLYNSAQ